MKHILMSKLPDKPLCGADFCGKSIDLDKMNWMAMMFRGDDEPWLVHVRCFSKEYIIVRADRKQRTRIDKMLRLMDCE